MKRYLNSFLFLFITALVLRVLFFVFCRSKFGDDGGEQLAYAMSLLQGKGYVVYRGFGGTPFYAFLPPLYPIFLALYKLVFPANMLALRFIFSIFGALTCVLTGRLGQYLFRREEGICAGWALSLYAGHIFWSTRFLPESAVMLLSTAAAWCLYRAFVNRPLKNSFMAGACAALATLGRGEFLILIFAMVLWLFSCRRLEKQVWRIFAGLMVGFCILYSPWVIRNYFIFHRLVITATNYGQNFYFGHCPYYRFGGVDSPVPEEMVRQLQGASEMKTCQALVSLGWAYCKEYPVRNIISTLINFLVFWRPFLTPGYIPWSLNIPFTLFAFPLLVFFLAGVLYILRLPEKSDWMLILFVILFKTLSHLPFYIVIRFRETMSPFLVLIAVFGFLSWKSEVVDNRP